MASQRPHVLILQPGGHTTSGTLTHDNIATQVPAQTVVGTTAHYVVYTDGSTDGNASAQAVLARCEDDYTAVAGSFNGVSLPPGQEGDDQTTPRTALPLHVLIDPQAGGAYHFGCDATDLYIQPQTDLAAGLVVAELVEVFEAAQGKGWSCGQTNGEALSRALATERTPALGSLTQQTGQGWWSNGHADYVTTNAADDQNQDSNGCGPLFLSYLHSQLGYSWVQIVAAGGSSLGATYQSLTGKSPATGFNDFLSRLQTLDNGGQISLPTSGNPFPISGTKTPGPSSSPSAGSGAPNLGSNALPIIVGVIVVAIIAAIVFFVTHH